MKVKCIISGHEAVITCEEVDTASAKFEYLMLGLRTRYGVSLKDYEDTFGTSIVKDFEKALKKSVDYLQLDGVSGWKPSMTGATASACIRA